MRKEEAKAAALAQAKREEEERNRPVAFKEGVVLCAAPLNGGKNWRCEGPLQVVTTNLDNPDSIISIGQACGSSRSVRPLGTASGYRAFGCGFGIHPSPDMRSYPGNEDVQAKYGVGHISGQGTFMCPVSTSAYCRGQ